MSKKLSLFIINQLFFYLAFCHKTRTWTEMRHDATKRGRLSWGRTEWWATTRGGGGGWSALATTRRGALVMAGRLLGRLSEWTTWRASRSCSHWSGNDIAPRVFGQVRAQVTMSSHWRWWWHGMAGGQQQHRRTRDILMDEHFWTESFQRWSQKVGLIVWFNDQWILIKKSKGQQNPWQN